jgi:hypothetical protein
MKLSPFFASMLPTKPPPPPTVPRPPAPPPSSADTAAFILAAGRKRRGELEPDESDDRPANPPRPGALILDAIRRQREGK